MFCSLARVAGATGFMIFQVEDITGYPQIDPYDVHAIGLLRLAFRPNRAVSARISIPAGMPYQTCCQRGASSDSEEPEGKLGMVSALLEMFMKRAFDGSIRKEGGLVNERSVLKEHGNMLDSSEC